MTNAVVTSKGKLPKAVDSKFVQGTVKVISQRTDQNFPEPEGQDTLNTIVDGKKLRERIPTLKFTFKFNRKLKQEDLRDMDQDIKKFFNVCQNMKPQPQGHAFDNPYQEEIQPDFLLDKKPRSLSQDQDGDKMSYSEKEALKQLPEATSWPNFLHVG
ncbi:hypothetical protein O181_049094 [Austropuccinia psidii MF-1]|uniref:Uncharacterized protein n=1 Tax=Austropuccinia psidii MF-1 TaxID=1389203 RepID=A0A9Q3HNH6_9BASI|nr:hypothetical protein [Austropuccinia psidii MF-1]